MQEYLALEDTGNLFAVLSDSTESYDRGGKFALYGQIPFSEIYAELIFSTYRE